eukprot:scaffold9267_cov112-Isochrysis_galbana.AAC.1
MCSTRSLIPWRACVVTPVTVLANRSRSADLAAAFSSACRASLAARSAFCRSRYGGRYRAKISRWLMRTGSAMPRHSGVRSPKKMRHTRHKTSRSLTSAGTWRVPRGAAWPLVSSCQRSWQHAAPGPSRPPSAPLPSNARCRASGPEAAATPPDSSAASSAAAARATSSASATSAASRSCTKASHNCNRSSGACHRASSSRNAKASTGAQGCGASASRPCPAAPPFAPIAPPATAPSAGSSSASASKHRAASRRTAGCASSSASCCRYMCHEGSRPHLSSSCTSARRQHVVSTRP